MQSSFILEDVQKIIPLNLEDISHTELHNNSWNMLYGKDFQQLQITIEPYKLVVLKKTPIRTLVNQKGISKPEQFYQFNTSTFTFTNPAPNIFSSFAAALLRSIIRLVPFIPRSFTFTITD